MPDRNAQNAPKDSLGHSLADVARLLAEKKLPPVDRWAPTNTGDSFMRIAADGSWFHEGRIIPRPALVKLFSTILRREPNGLHVLVTPVEKLDIEVEDAPFVAVEATSEGAGKDRRIGFRLNTDDYVIAGPDHELRVETAEDGSPRPYLHVRGGLDALVARSVFYELVELALAEGGERVGLWSEGAFFDFGAAAA
ncbi:DUF1285 domain-containing protein [Sphingoaurantiacus capsulatus]|uniref:DUF1285 domain-containing protein n=1 Tax=Sphingoaurantiacus capsulatus TaxID=1771310 RepID=A0ABV7X7I1_9SPHN